MHRTGLEPMTFALLERYAANYINDAIYNIEQYTGTHGARVVKTI